MNNEEKLTTEVEIEVLKTKIEAAKDEKIKADLVCELEFAEACLIKEKQIRAKYGEFYRIDVPRKGKKAIAYFKQPPFETVAYVVDNMEKTKIPTFKVLFDTCILSEYSDPAFFTADENTKNALFYGCIPGLQSAVQFPIGLLKKN
jgi:hypothetical protein